MLKEILSITGKPGLSKLITGGKKMIVVESLLDAKRFPIHSHEKVVSLADIAIYTETAEVPLREVLQKIQEKEQKNQQARKVKNKKEGFWGQDSKSLLKTIDNIYNFWYHINCF